MTKDAKIAVSIGLGALAISVPFIVMPLLDSRSAPKPSIIEASEPEPQRVVALSTNAPSAKPYTFNVEVGGSLPGLKGTPIRGYSLLLRYATPPSREDAIKACVEELEKMASSLFAMHRMGGTNIEASAYVYLGDKQMVDPDQAGSETGKRKLAVHLDVKDRKIFMIPRLFQEIVLKQL